MVLTPPRCSAVTCAHGAARACCKHTDAGYSVRVAARPCARSGPRALLLMSSPAYHTLTQQLRYRRGSAEPLCTTFVNRATAAAFLAKR